MKIGKALGYQVISASNDRSRNFQGKNFSSLCLPCFPEINVEKETKNTIALIDVIWFEKNTKNIVCAFEVEKSTSIYSGILRLTDLYHSFPENPSSLFLIIPDNREKELLLQLSRPSIKSNGTKIHYIKFSDLKENCEAICKFGTGKETLLKIANQ